MNRAYFSVYQLLEANVATQTHDAEPLRRVQSEVTELN